MKLAFSFVVTVLAWAASLAAESGVGSDHHHQSDSPSVHGMLMVGRSKIYLSHLPMFHSPHDYQVILEVELSTEAKKTYLDSLGASAETVYTLVPETFVLPEMISSPRPFKASLFKGHFERGGHEIAKRVEVQIKKVVFFAKFDPTATHHANATYLVFGHATEQFLAHVITSKPDFDHLVEVKVLDSRVVTALEKRNHMVAYFEGLTGTVPIPNQGKFQAIVKTAPVETEATVEVVRSLYLETSDLAF